MKKVLKWGFIILFVAPLGFGIVANIIQRSLSSEEDNLSKDGSSVNLLKTNESKSTKNKIPSNIYWVMTKKDFPKAYKVWGQNGFDKINKLAPLAAELVAQSRKCDELVEVALSDSKSKPKSEIVFFVDCKNKERFFVSEKDIKENNKVRTVNEQFSSKNKQKYFDSCLESIKSQANYPSSIETGILDRTIQPSTTGGVIVRMDFKAKNGFGMESKYTARCDFSGGGENSISIFEAK